MCLGSFARKRPQSYLCGAIIRDDDYTAAKSKAFLCLAVLLLAGSNLLVSLVVEVTQINNDQIAKNAAFSLLEHASRTGVSGVV